MMMGEIMTLWTVVGVLLIRAINCRDRKAAAKVSAICEPVHVSLI
jgi:hypothetical protein